MGVASLALRSTPSVCNLVRNKKVYGFPVALCPKLDYRGSLKRVSLVKGCLKGAHPIATNTIWEFSGHTLLVGSWDISLAVNIMVVAGANLEWGCFVCPSCSQKRENTAFELVLWSAWGLSSPGKQVARSRANVLKHVVFVSTGLHDKIVNHCKYIWSQDYYVTL